MNKETRNCQNCKKDFVIEPEDFTFYEKIKVPPPTWCPECRMIRRMNWRNEWKLFKKKSALDGKEIFSNWPAHAPNRIYPKEYWWSDAWEPMEYGRDYDFSRPFFEQFRELIQTVPFPSRALLGDVVNSDYSMNAGWLKNCYLVFNADYFEDSAYVVGGVHAKNCFDCTMLTKTELSYDSVNLSRCYRTFYSVNCEDCSDVLFSRDCTGCSNCFGCAGLKNKSFHIFNKPYTKDDYLKELGKFSLDSHSSLEKIRKEVNAHWRKFPVKYVFGRHNVNAGGEYIQNSRNIRFGYRINEGENLKFCQMILNGPAKDSYDQTTWGNNTELIYESGQCGGGAHGVQFCYGVYGEVKDIQYSVYCHNSSNLFGCIGLRNKQYCIFNKQYSKEDYESSIFKVKAHMEEMPYRDAKGRLYGYGEFFPPEISPLAYNETLAQEYNPITREQVLQMGYRWTEVPAKEYEISIKAGELADSIKDVSDDIVNSAIGCSHEGECNHGCSKAFRIIPEELKFYRKFNIPLPRLCFPCRHSERLQYRRSIRLYKRACQCAGAKSENGVYANVSPTHTPHPAGEKCPNTFETSYAPDRPEIVYCEQCYNAEVV